MRTRSFLIQGLSFYSVDYSWILDSWNELRQDFVEYLIARLAGILWGLPDTSVAGLRYIWCFSLHLFVVVKLFEIVFEEDHFQLAIVDIFYCLQSLSTQNLDVCLFLNKEIQNRLLKGLLQERITLNIHPFQSLHLNQDQQLVVPIDPIILQVDLFQISKLLDGPQSREIIVGDIKR